MQIDYFVLAQRLQDSPLYKRLQSWGCNAPCRMLMRHVYNVWIGRPLVDD